ncbi:unnamed protein product [Phytomonas sp. Hart1]|nr:unnamed protein product [Phytomonas sp. Hart1]|eukprot:CCW72247.1 unnamed protein product [Phytomonas sp. isolate Hart1]
MRHTKRARTEAVTPKPIGRFLVSDAAIVKKNAKWESIVGAAYHTDDSEIGNGTPGNPYRLPLRKNQNRNGCYHCLGSYCKCLYFESLLSQVYEQLPMKRVTEVAGSRHLCAKSLLPTFIARAIRLMKITSSDIFYDLGCGNGSVLFQVACQTGAKCIGIEISQHNAKIAQEAWPIFRSLYETHNGKTMGSVEIIVGDIAEILSNPGFLKCNNGNVAILLSNLLFPKPLTHYTSERLRDALPGTRVLCFDDLYPHGRSVASIRDPGAFALFEMKDYKWQEMSVEWCASEGDFYIHWHR